MLAGRLREKLTIQTNQPVAIGVRALTWAAGVAAAVTPTAHGYVTGDFVTIAGATPAGYNGKVRVTTTSATGFTYPVATSLTTPATGSISAIYASDTRGGRVGLTWRTLMAVRAELMPERSFDRLERQAIETGLNCRFRVRARAELVAGLRAAWTPSWPPRTPERTFVVKGVELNMGDPRESFLVCEQVTL